MHMIIADFGAFKPIPYFPRFICMLFSTYTWAIKMTCNGPKTNKLYLPQETELKCVSYE